MKKLFSIILALSMTVALLCNPALALTPAGEREAKDSPNQQNTVDVKIQMDPNGVVHKYCIDIEYTENMVFTYDEGGGTWDPNDYEYKDRRASRWIGEGEITIINHSDRSVHYDITPENVSRNYGDLTVHVSHPTDTTIGACSPGTEDGSMKAKATITVSGDPNENLTSTPVVLGQVRIVIS